MTDLNTIQTAIDRIKNEAAPGEKPLDTLFRLIGVKLTVSVPEPVVEQSPVKYRFKVWPAMNDAMGGRYGPQWMSGVSSSPNALSAYYGVTPDDEKIQADMRRVYEGGSDEAAATLTTTSGSLIRYSRPMIEPVSG